MPVAVCIKCGGRKDHALAACPKCNFAPKRKDDEAKSFYLSSHNLSPEDLADAVERIERGEPIPYNKGRLKGVVAKAEVKIIYGLPIDHWKKLGMAAVAGVLLGSCLWGLLSMRDLF
jgi:hypothetical protein